MESGRSARIIWLRACIPSLNLSSRFSGIFIMIPLGRINTGFRTGFREKASNCLGKPMKATGLDCLQVNLGYACNLACKHCHLEAGAARTESMGSVDISHVLTALSHDSISTLDITGGAPELNPGFRGLVESACRMRKHVVVRTNLVILEDEAMSDLPEFFADNSVEIVASLPHYTRESVDRVRGPGAFERSIRVLKGLNSLGYGKGELVLRLVSNPPDASFPLNQQMLEAEFRRELMAREGVEFTGLYAFTNMPIGRFREFLKRSGQYDGYMKRLADAFNPCALESVMCRRLISVGPDGMLYDCDFNQAAGLGLVPGAPGHISEFDHDALAGRVIMVDEHCHGCAAGQGST